MHSLSHVKCMTKMLKEALSWGFGCPHQLKCGHTTFYNVIFIVTLLQWPLVLKSSKCQLHLWSGFSLGHWNSFFLNIYLHFYCTSQSLSSLSIIYALSPPLGKMGTEGENDLLNICCIWLYVFGCLWIFSCHLTAKLELLCNNWTLLEVWFYKQLVLVPSSNSFWWYMVMWKTDKHLCLSH